MSTMNECERTGMVDSERRQREPMRSCRDNATNVCFWHLADIDTEDERVRFWG
jgi:hypothetical protein